MAFCVVRFNKIKSSAHLVKASRHNDRQAGVENADPKRRGQNEVLVDPGRDALAKWESMVGDRKVRKNAVIACEVTLIRSPEWVGDEAAWTKLSQEWLVKTFGSERILSSMVHRDELTPHLQAIIVPLNQSKLDCAGLWGGRFFLNGLQTSYAEQMAPLGLSRGEEGSSADHQSRHEHAQLLDKATKTAPTPPKPNLLGIIPQAEAQRVHGEALAAHRLATVEKAKAQKLKVENTDMAKELAKLRTDRLRAIPLVQVLEKLGAEQDKSDSLKWTLPTGVLVVREKGEGSRFHLVTSGGGGRGAHDLVMRALGCDFKSAGSWLAHEFGVESTTLELRSSPTFLSKYVENCAKLPVPSVPPIPANWDRVREYLVKVRNLAGQLVDKLHDAGRIYADFKNNVIFRHAAPDGTLGGCEKRGTTGPKWVGASGPKTGFLVEGTKPGLVVVESAIDAISCVQVTGMSAVSSGGANSGTMAVWSQWAKSQGVPVYAGQDKDEAGESMAELLLSAGAKRLPPTRDANDWNEVVEFQAKDEERRQNFEKLFPKGTEVSFDDLAKSFGQGKAPRAAPEQSRDQERGRGMER